jgi:hypothetical protein
MKEFFFLIPLSSFKTAGSIGYLHPRLTFDPTAAAGAVALSQ